MASEAITYDKAELRSITRSFKAMEDTAIAEAKESSSALATFVQGQIINAALTRDTASIRACKDREADG